MIFPHIHTLLSHCITWCQATFETWISLRIITIYIILLEREIAKPTKAKAFWGCLCIWVWMCNSLRVRVSCSSCGGEALAKCSVHLHWGFTVICSGCLCRVVWVKTFGYAFCRTLRGKAACSMLWTSEPKGVVMFILEPASQPNALMFVCFNFL